VRQLAYICTPFSMTHGPTPQGPTDTVWASSKMRSFAPTYDSIVVDLCRRTPSNILSEAASQAQEEAMSIKSKRR
jgi:hypothetical protein